ncbi:hypothetical protein N7478_005480 [Penicillium angulare]|uniref:uncharacterized protein n=1 Tax=Penicillium angulare TaxID=116970 RepID=UPI00253F66D0|nr:uncharacterized protein N7478_005480 [Penicillium angulare]KAJ5280108.1 hypothetical protein N7478_005480 [Penicillium angulare]
MDNQPPPAFGGHPNFAQQWPPPYPPIMPSDFPSNTEYHASAQIPPPNPAQHLDANMASFYANSHLAGAASHTHPGLFFPPPLPYMNQFQTSQQPLSAFPPIPMQSLGYPMMPALPGSSIPPPTSADAQAPHSNRQSHVTSAFVDRNREEGEISEEETRPSATSQKTSRSKRAKQKRASSQLSDLEDGETMSSPSVSSSRSSSPYNPSLPVAADPEVVSQAIEMQKREATATAPKDTRGLVSAGQLRLRAQGALLSLKPHNISYEELVAEGLNPRILRQLYEQVGLRIAPQADKPISLTNNHPALSTKQTAPAVPKKIDHSRRKSSTAPPTPAPPAPSVSKPETGKPMERKEVIARMLAAKAAKTSAVPAKSAPKESQATSPTPVSATPEEPKAKSNIVTVREKNKAQTELARQRIEELKRQALLKSQEKSQFAQSSPDSQVDSLAGSAVQHPLPVRPPIPQPSDAASIPGLVMTESKNDAGLQPSIEASQTINVDSTPLSRTSHRKRPRASDFDEPDAAAKRPSGYEKGPVGHTDRLVIEFSDDDESFYGDDPDTMKIDSDQDQPTTSITTLDISRPVLQKYPSSTSTPQGPSWQSDNENMRQKDLEIQEMHRKIAELEERRKAKLVTSRAESPRTVNDSASSSPSSSESPFVAQSIPVDADVAKASHVLTAETADKKDQNRTDLPDKSVPIESLDESSVEALRRQAEIKQNPVTEELVSVPSQTSADMKIQSMTDAPASEPQPTVAALSFTQGCEVALPVGLTRNSTEVSSSPHSESMSSAMDESEDISSPSQDSPGENEYAAPGGQQTLDPLATSFQPQNEGSASMPEIPGSSEDESSDSLNSDASSSDQESLMDAEHLNLDHSSLENPSPALDGKNIPSQDSGNMDTRSERSNHESGSESESESDESEAYEPPEPDASTEPNSPYSPPFSPAPHVPVEKDQEIPAVSLDGTPADDSLTGAPQVATSELHPSLQVETLGSNTSTAVTPGSKFTPYISPLRHFKAYRYHPAFTDDVSSGYRSLTYSHDIDAMKYFCPYEMAGGVCNDRSCEFQHFRDINLSDDKILIEMGSVREGQTEEEKETYIAGLKGIINEMRRDKVKDFSTVASEIVAYRRRFLQDPSRVLPL